MRRLLLAATLVALWWGLPTAQISTPLSLILTNEGSVQGSVRELNCVGSGINCTVSGSVGTVDASAGSGAPADATYITQTANAGLSAEQALGALATGILKSTTTTGVVSIAVAGDFPTLNQNTTGTASNVTGTVAIANGGTGQTTQTAAFDALAPTTTAGDLIYHNGTDNVRLGIGTAGQFLQTNAGATAPQWTTIDTVLTLGSQVATAADTNLVDITGMTFSAVAGGIYQFTIMAAINNAANTTGYGIGINCAQAPQRVWMTGTSQLANTGTVSTWSAIANNAIVGVTSGVPTNATDVPTHGSGTILANAATTGNCTFRLRSETTAVARIQAGSLFIVTRRN